MTPEQYIRVIRQAWPDHGPVPAATLEMCRAAVRRYPDSPGLLCLYADLIHFINIPRHVASVLARCAEDAPSDQSDQELRDMIEELLCSAGGPRLDPDPLDLYRHAVEIDPDHAEAWESMGHYLDAIKDDHRGARRALKRAIRLGATAHAWATLARLAAERGRKRRALRLVDRGLRLFPESEELPEVRKEIEAGEWDPQR